MSKTRLFVSLVAGLGMMGLLACGDIGDHDMEPLSQGGSFDSALMAGVRSGEVSPERYCGAMMMRGGMNGDHRGDMGHGDADFMGGEHDASDHVGDGEVGHNDLDHSDLGDAHMGDEVDHPEPEAGAEAGAASENDSEAGAEDESGAAIGAEGEDGLPSDFDEMGTYCQSHSDDETCRMFAQCMDSDFGHATEGHRREGNGHGRGRGRMMH